MFMFTRTVCNIRGIFTVGGGDEVNSTHCAKNDTVAVNLSSHIRKYIMGVEAWGRGICG